MRPIASYLQNGRLADVLALIQVLAYDRSAYRTESGLDEELQRKPQTGGTWMDLAGEHPEFFRVRRNPEKEPRAAILSRYVLDREKLADGDYKHPALSPVVANKLMELAIELHNKQLDRKRRFMSVILPMCVAIIAAAASITSAVIGLKKPPSVSTQAAQVEPLGNHKELEKSIRK
jgi:hypothetical protein